MRRGWEADTRGLLSRTATAAWCAIPEHPLTEAKPHRAVEVLTRSPRSSTQSAGLREPLPGSSRLLPDVHILQRSFSVANSNARTRSRQPIARTSIKSASELRFSPDQRGLSAPASVNWRTRTAVGDRRNKRSEIGHPTVAALRSIERPHP
ncbi:Uncharacterised protein [Mycobacteroides abscessus subsp. abscessus]|nr:Uncharacterised protein [Mycobacteroides abscessus subsp. abscessus]